MGHLSMKTILLIIMSVLFTACIFDTAQSDRDVSDEAFRDTIYPPHAVTDRYIADKAAIARSYRDLIVNSIDSIAANESYRMPYFDCALIAKAYQKYAGRHKNKVSDIDDFCKVYIDTIFYNRDSLVCVAIMAQKVFYKKNDPEKKNEFKAFALTGYRDSIGDIFRIYNYSGNGGAVKKMRNKFVDELSEAENHKGILRLLAIFYLEHTGYMNLQGDKFDGGINNPDYFDEMFLFQKNKYGNYYMQYDVRTDVDKLPYFLPLNYYCNAETYINGRKESK